MNDIKTVGVIGGGTMGNGIAHLFALHGFQVRLAEREQKLLDRAMEIIAGNLNRLEEKGRISDEERLKTLDRITGYVRMEEAAEETQLIIEAVPEDIELKSRILAELSAVVAEDIILATNTSSISITRLGGAVLKPGRFLGIHFFNPVPVMKLVEIVRGVHTDREVVSVVEKLATRLGKTPVTVRDSPGFVSNRVLMPMINEAIFCVYEGVATAEETDEVMKLGMAHPMGPLRLADYIGLDVCLDILNVLYEGFRDPKYRPCPLLVQMVDAGFLGDKTGRGFYEH